MYRLLLLALISLGSLGGQFTEIPTPIRRAAFGAIHNDSGVTNNTSGTPTKVVGTFVLSGLGLRFDNPSDGMLRYTGAETLTFDFEAHLSFTSTVNNIILTLAVAKNGTPIANADSERKIGAGADVGAMSLSFFVSLATNDYLEVFIDTSSGDPAITTEHLTLTARSLN